MQEFEIIAKTFQGLEEVLAQEITELGAKNIKTGRRMVSLRRSRNALSRQFLLTHGRKGAQAS